MKKWLLILLFASILITLYLIFGELNKQSTYQGETVQPSSKVMLQNEKLNHSDSQPKASSVNELDNFENGLVEQLKRNYSEHINNLAVQASLLEIKKQLLSMDPVNGATIFELAIKEAFPEHAKSILIIIAGMEIYEDWLSTNQQTLNELAPLEKNGTLWNKRHKIFGKNADLIWAHEREALMKKQVQIQDTIHRLDKATDISLNEKLYQLRDSIDEAYSGTLEGLTSNASVISQVFFGLDSVQKELKVQSDKERQNTINNIRKQLGYSADQIAIQQTHDEDHNARWKVGNSYMVERDKLTEGLNESQSKDPQLLKQIQLLRKKYFKNAAETIKKEEEGGFMRFKRPRIYGRN